MVDVLDFLEYVLPSVCTINRGIPVLGSMIGILKKLTQRYRLDNFTPFKLTLQQYCVELLKFLSSKQ